jgi:hypothetical protein
MPFQLDKKKLMIGGGLLVLLIIVIIVAVAMKKKSAQEHAADAQNAANMAVMHAKIAQAAASSPDNSAKDSIVKAAIDGANQAAAQANDSTKKAVASGSGTSGSGTSGSGTSGSGTSGSNLYYLYFPRDNLYLNTQTLAMVPNKSNASVVYWDPNSLILSNSDKSTLTIEGVQVQATTDLPYPGANGPRVALSQYASPGTLFPAGQSASGQPALGAGTFYTIQQALYDPSYTFVFQKA